MTDTLDPATTTSYTQMSSLYLCGTCKHPVTWEEKGILCESCDCWFHHCCQEIRSAEYATMDDPDVLWTCSLCNGPNYSTTTPVDIYAGSEYDSNDSHPERAHLSLSTDSVRSLDDRHTPIHTSSPSKYHPTYCTGRPLRILNVNCQSICNKKGAWINLLHSTKPDIILATETWLDPTISSGELECDGFAVYRRDRQTGARGGVMIAINSEITSSEIRPNKTSHSEILWAKIHCSGHKDILIAACYRPDVSDKESITDLRASIESLMDNRKRQCGMMIGGDFNLPGWDWSVPELKPGTAYSSLHNEFKELLDDYSLTQHITEPTRLKNTLDLIATNMPDQVNRMKILPGISDHEIAYMELSVRPLPKRQAPRKIWLYNKADWAGMKEYLNPRLERLNMGYNPCVDTMWTDIKDLLIEAAGMFIPRKTTKKKDACPWMDRELLNLMNTRDRLFRRSKKGGSEKIEKRYLLYKSTVQAQLRRRHRAYVHNLFTSADLSKDDPSKRFWRYIKHRRSPTVSNIDPLRSGNKLLTSPLDKANLLNDQFVSVFSKPGERVQLSPTLIPTLMNDIVITEAGVLKELKRLKPHKASGPDEISPRILLEMADVLAGPLATLFQLSLDKATVPADWKTATVCPVYKKGEKHAPANYRPISLTCVSSKILEHIVTNHLMTFADQHNILFENQHGFRKNKSCEKQLIELVADMTDNLDKGHQTEACVLDFAKAFDKVNHQKLVSKLEEAGVCHQVNSWIQDFLSGRTQRVAVEGALSDTASVTSGVPQGSVVGPTLFLFYINDLPTNIKSTVRLFADDTILYNTAQNHVDLQNDLDRLHAWEEKWDMEFHPAKCQHLTVTRKTKPVDLPLRLHSTTIPKTDHIKYLGVTVDSKLTWTRHIHNITAKANSTLGFAKRTLTTPAPDLRSLAYKQLVRPVLEYASGAWDSITPNLTKLIERTQRRAARFAGCLKRSDWTTSVSKILQTLDWDPLDVRRRDRRLTLFAEMHHNNANPVKQYLVRKEPTRNLRQHLLQYSIPHSRSEHHKRSFVVRTAREWNQLPRCSPLLVPPDRT